MSFFNISFISSFRFSDSYSPFTYRSKALPGATGLVGSRAALSFFSFLAGVATAVTFSFPFPFPFPPFPPYPLVELLAEVALLFLLFRAFFIPPALTKTSISFACRALSASARAVHGWREGVTQMRFMPNSHRVREGGRERGAGLAKQRSMREREVGHERVPSSPLPTSLATSAHTWT